MFIAFQYMKAKKKNPAKLNNKKQKSNVEVLTRMLINWCFVLTFQLFTSQVLVL